MIIAITCTGARPEAFALCEKYMARQTVYPDQWIVVDDCDPATKCTMGQTVIRPEPRWPEFPEPNTQHRNMMAAVDYIKRGVVNPNDQIIFFEDDDWYRSDYIETQRDVMNQFAFGLVGEIPARYYHVKNRAFRVFDELAMNNPVPHASLCATSMRGYVLPVLIDALECRAWIDMYLWRKAGTPEALFGGASVVGINQM